MVVESTLSKLRTMRTLALLDGHSLAYRAFYALPVDLATATGQVTNAVFGFTSMLIKLLRDERPDAIAVAWDVKGPTFRKEMYDEYKSQRESPPDLFLSQLPLMDEVLDALEITQFRVSGFEADDVIATLATRAEQANWNVLVVTGDRDAFQLVDGSVQVLYTRRGISDTVRADETWISEKYGVAPAQYLDYAALRGDVSDNLPGVPGVGDKTAAKLIADYDCLENVYAHLDEQTPKLRQNLAVHMEQTFLNRDLMRLVRDVAIEGLDEESGSIDGLRIREWNRDRAREVFDGLAFQTLWNRLEKNTESKSVDTRELEVDVGSVTVADDIPVEERAVLDLVFDTGEVAGVIVLSGSRCVFVPEAHFDQVVIALADIPIVAHDAKPLVKAFVDRGFPEPKISFDTALAAYLVNPAQRTPSLEELAYRELAVTLTSSSDVSSEVQGTFDFEMGTEGPDLDEAGRRALVVSRLINPLAAQISASGGERLFEEIELPLIPVLARMEEIGIAADREFLENFRAELLQTLAGLEHTIHEIAGKPFNVKSTLQLREILFERLNLPVLKKTPKGAPSTDASVLQKLRHQHPLVDNLVTFRELEKLRSTYVDALVPLIEGDGRIRGRFNQMTTSTGRLSQEQPNLQNIPVRSEEGRKIRKAFISEEGNSLLVADYSQIELRILAHLSRDPGLVDAFARDLDIHTMTAARIGDMDPSEVTPDIRRRAKGINFGLLYGMEAFGLAQRLAISREEAQEHIEDYFNQFPDVREFMSGVVSDARKKGYTTTLLGRRRYLPELSSLNFRERQSGERMALNAPIQGSAADIIKKAMVVLAEELRSAGSSAEMLLQIHDELVLEVPDNELSDIRTLTVEVMQGIVDLVVPLKVDAAEGKSLADCKD